MLRTTKTGSTDASSDKAPCWSVYLDKEQLIAAVDEKWRAASAIGASETATQNLRREDDVGGSRVKDLAKTYWSEGQAADSSDGRDRVVATDRLQTRGLPGVQLLKNDSGSVYGHISGARTFNWAVVQRTYKSWTSPESLVAPAIITRPDRPPKYEEKGTQFPVDRVVRLAVGAQKGDKVTTESEEPGVEAPVGAREGGNVTTEPKELPDKAPVFVGLATSRWVSWTWSKPPTRAWLKEGRWTSWWRWMMNKLLPCVHVVARVQPSELTLAEQNAVLLSPLAVDALGIRSGDDVVIHSVCAETKLSSRFHESRGLSRLARSGYRRVVRQVDRGLAILDRVLEPMIQLTFGILWNPSYGGGMTRDLGLRFAKQSTDNPWTHVTIKSKAYVVPEDVLVRRMKQHGGEWTAPIPSDSETLGDPSHLPWIWMDASLRQQLGLPQKFATVIVAPSRTYVAWEHIRQFLTTILLAIVALVLDHSNGKDSPGWSSWAIITVAGIALAVAFWRMRIRLR